MTPAKRGPDLSTYSGRFAARLRELREKAKLSQTELAAKLGVTQLAVSKWETARTRPSIEMLPALAAALNLKKAKDVLPNE